MSKKSQLSAMYYLSKHGRHFKLDYIGSAQWILKEKRNIYSGCCSDGTLYSWVNYWKVDLNEKK